MIKAIIFDMDGVIVDSEPLWAAAYRQQLTRHNKKVPQTSAHRQFINKYYRGRGQTYAIRKMKEYFELSESIGALLRERIDLLLRLFKTRLRLVPGAQSLLRRLSKHYPIALASAAPPEVIDYAIKKFKLRSFFKIVISGDDCRRSKPHPEIFLTAAKKLKVKPDECLVIEDSLNGVTAAHQARMHCIGLQRPHNKPRDLRQADYTVSKLTQITPASIKKIV